MSLLGLKAPVTLAAWESLGSFFFFNRWLQRISRILAVLGYEGVKQRGNHWDQVNWSLIAA